MSLTGSDYDPLHDIAVREGLVALGTTLRHNSERWFPDAHEGRYPPTWFYAIGLAGEVGEACNLVKKEMRDGAVITHVLPGELADVLVYLLLLADERGIDLMVALRAKVYECEARWGTV